MQQWSIYLCVLHLRCINFLKHTQSSVWGMHAFGCIDFFLSIMSRIHNMYFSFILKISVFPLNDTPIEKPPCYYCRLN